MTEFLALALFAVTFVLLLSGYPVPFVLSGVAILFALIGLATGTFELNFLQAIPNRIFTVMTNELLIAVPLFIFMGCTLERSGLAEELLDTLGLLFGPVNGGYAISTALVGLLLAASTGIVGATVITMGLISLPAMLKRHYNTEVATGIICASGTLGQIIPPSIVLIILGDVMSTAYQEAQLASGNFAPKTVSIGDLFVGAILPGCLLVTLYIVYLVVIASTQPQKMPAIPADERQQLRAGVNLTRRVIFVLMPPLLLIFLVLGSILGGWATPTEAGSIGGVGALLMTLFKKRLTVENLKKIVETTTIVSTKVFLIFIGAAFFSLVFRGFGGDMLIADFLLNLPGEKITAFVIVMIVIFLLGFFLDFIEITLIIVPIIAPILLTMGFDPIWLGIMFAVNLQTSFLTPPFGFALFYLAGVAPKSVQIKHIYRGVIPFIGIQILVLFLLWYFPDLITYLPKVIY